MIAENNMRCSKCGREAFLLSTAQKWRLDNWLVTERFYCSSCGTMYVSENGEIWQIPVKQ
jgi:ribosomal protein S27AE